MENITLEKFNGFNFHTWKLKIQLQMMHRNLWGIVKGTEKSPTDPRQLIEWENKYDRAKSILGLSLADSQLHLIDLEKSSAELLKKLNTRTTIDKIETRTTTWQKRHNSQHIFIHSNVTYL
jgi:hypothetical protein